MVKYDNINIPSWYQIEKETGKTIQSLTSFKELVFYLENPDPFVRRLAILRLGQLKQKESYTLLHGILDDSLETEENRELAALLMQKLNHELNLGFFISHSYLSRFSGEEDLATILKVNVVDPLPDIRLNFENALIESQLHLDNEFLKINIDEKDDVLPFSLKDWVRHFSSGMVLDAKKGLKQFFIALVTVLFVKAPKKLISAIASLPKRLAARKEARAEARAKARTEAATVATTEAIKVAPAEVFPELYFPTQEKKSFREPKHRSVTYTRKRANTYRPPLSTRLKGLARNFFRLLFLPFRVIYHYKVVILLTLIAMYSLFSFTSPGKSFLFRINPQVYYLNIDFMDQAKGALLQFVGTNETLAAVFGTRLPMPTQEQKEVVIAKKFAVTASKGLYLRTEPNSNGGKITLMKTKTMVEFLGEESRDQSGGLWLKVYLDKDTSGWANAQYLKEEKDEQ